MIKLILFLFYFSNLISQEILLDDFTDKTKWKSFASDGVEAIIENDTSDLNIITVKFNFKSGAGYGGIFKTINLDLPENYQFTFFVKGNLPKNNFEIKFCDTTGENVWWMNNRNFEFTNEWKKIRIKKRDISFAWGPNKNQLNKIKNIEFTIATGLGGNGKIQIKDLTFEKLENKNYNYSDLVLHENINVENPLQIMDKNKNSFATFFGETSSIVINLINKIEFGGLSFYWKKSPRSFKILYSIDGRNYFERINLAGTQNGLNFIPLYEDETKFIKIDVIGFAELSEFEINPLTNSQNENKIFEYIASKKEKGLYPKYFLNEANYWNIVGVEEDKKEALINEYGMVEIDKLKYSIEPFVHINNQFYNWNNVKSEQKLLENYLPISIVDWNAKDFKLSIEPIACGEKDKSILVIEYKVANTSNKNINADLFLAIRPFQVNPTYQFLNNSGGVAKIKSIEKRDNYYFINDESKIFYENQKHEFGAVNYFNGDITDYIKENKLPQNQNILDSMQLASAGLKYKIQLKPSESKVIKIAIPFYSDYNLDVIDQIFSNFENTKNSIVNKWKNKFSNVKIILPKKFDYIINSLKSNLAYILINKDDFAIQPGSRSYERGWIRDGSLTSTALLRFGFNNEVKDYLNWYKNFQFESGKIPCVVDSRGPDPVNEHDSHGQLIYGINQYFSFTNDTSFLRNAFPIIIKDIKYIESLILERSTDYYKNGNDSLKSIYGLVPESISHEGYSDKPRHSYWDNYFILRGLIDAVEIANILNEVEYENNFTQLKNKFEKDLSNSVINSMKYKNINFIPGCVELGDFDATSTAIAIAPLNLENIFNKNSIQSTFDKYLDFFNTRSSLNNWDGYTPYEIRIVSALINLNRRDDAWKILKWFFNHQRPKNWNHWAEVVWNDPKKPNFIGDMPHTWVGSEYVNAVRTIFVLEKNNDELFLGSGIPDEWIKTNEEIKIEDLATIYGDISYSIKKNGDKLELKCETKNLKKSVRTYFNLPSLNGNKIIILNNKIITPENLNKIRIN